MQASVITATIAEASAIRNQGGRSSNIQRFEAHYTTALKGGGDPMVAGHCFRLVRKDTVASTKRKENKSSSEDFFFIRISETGPRLSGPRPSWGF